MLSLGELLATVGVSTGTLMFAAVVTAVLSAPILTGRTVRIGVWFEELMYRHGVCGAADEKRLPAIRIEPAMGIDDPPPQCLSDA